VTVARGQGLLRVIALAALTLLPQHVARAADISSLKLDKDLTAILLVGDIQSGDEKKFSAEAAKYESAVVLLESEGGSVPAALQIGEAIRLKGFGTWVINGSDCNSACALIWLAGTPRALSKSARVGFHAAYIESTGASRESGVGNALVGRYLTLLNLPERAVEFATTAPPTSLNWLTSSNYQSTGIETSIIDDIALDKGATEKQQNYKAQSRPETELWRRVNNWYVYVDHTLDEGCFLMSGFTNNTRFRIGVNPSEKGSYYLIIGNDDWKSLKEDSEYDLTFKFDDQSPWNVPTTGVRMGNEIDLMAKFSDTSFWGEFVSAYALDVTRNGVPVTKLSMAGTKDAFDELIRCQEYENASRRGRDPFAQ
jgi:hypothetical protein